MLTKFKTKMRSFGLLVMILASLGLTSCATAPSPPPASSVVSLTLYQPLVLRLSKGQTVQTPQGQYTPQVDETWYSPGEYAKILNQLYNALNAVNQKKLNP